ncbi:alpha/beta hydrolase family protein [Clostridium brassicae]|uniref:Alpha/beta fold hydrolase n=1 Tax=Clostridium brassicae TaxID=2999072 RepID=A0ABT4D8F2_9CLOT|nr:alpha/beta fold hydrolase [Clostridium brassicae]MCY6958550.1 alpha/beta fold hydrolase [Clostridium brassicae]
MQKAITLVHNKMILRGMEHVPESNKKLPAVILFHGFTGNKLEKHQMFLKISRSLEMIGIASFRFDFLGSGESDGHFKDMTVSGELAEANTILDFVRKDNRIDSDRIIILGFSMGGLVASLLAGERSKDIYKLILISAAGTIKDSVNEVSKQVLKDRNITTFDCGGNIVGVQFAADLNKIDVFNRASNYKGDVLLVHGTKDETVPCNVSSIYNEKSYENRAILKLIEGAGHTFDKFEWENEVIDLVGGFLK